MLFQIELDEDWIRSMSKNKLKKLLKQKMSEAALTYLYDKKKSKVKDIPYLKLSPMPYIMSGDLTEEQKQMLFSLHSRMLRVKSNLSGMFPGNKICSLGCQAKEEENHLLSCTYLIENLTMRLSSQNWSIVMCLGQCKHRSRYQRCS